MQAGHLSDGINIPGCRRILLALADGHTARVAGSEL